MAKEQRLRSIMQRVESADSVSIEELRRELGVSYMTMWRDLANLEQQGLVRRVRGAVISVQPDHLASTAAFPNFDFTRDPYHHLKLRIAQYAARELVCEGDRITIEAGTTASLIVPALQQQGLTILTNGLMTALLAARRLPDLTIMCSGGILISTGAFIGPPAEEFFPRYRVQKAFFSAQGLTLEDGFTDPTPLYTRLKCAMRQNADRTIVLIDSSKFGFNSLVQVMRLDEVDTIVTDAGASPAIVSGLHARGIEVLVVE
jgi:DeoR/GlpR family transcriptional regulator of sugar metabolism